MLLIEGKNLQSEFFKSLDNKIDYLNKLLEGDTGEPEDIAEVAAFLASNR